MKRFKLKYASYSLDQPLTFGQWGRPPGPAMPGSARGVTVVGLQAEIA